MSGLTQGQVQAMILANERKRDILRYPTRINPTSSVFTTVTNLDKVTDDDISTYAEGSKTGVASSGQAGSFLFDLGFVPTKAYKLSVLPGIIASAGNPSIYLDQSVIGDYTDVQRTTLANPTAPTTEKRPSVGLVNVWSRYFKIGFFAGSSAADITGRLYGAKLLDIPQVS